MMPEAFNPDEAEGMTAVYQFEVSGDEAFTAHLKIENRTVVFHEGPSDNPSVTIKTPADLWVSIAQGKMDGAQAFMSGKYTVDGDVNLLMKLQSLFKRS